MNVMITGSSNGRLSVKFPYNRCLIDAMKSVPGFIWDPVNRFWSFADKQEKGDQILKSLFLTGLFNYGETCSSTNDYTELLNTYIETLERRHYSKRT